MVQQHDTSKLRAGVGRADITAPGVLVSGVDVSAVRTSSTSAASSATAANPMYAKCLLIEAEGGCTVGIVTLDVVSYGEIGHIKGDFIPTIRARVSEQLGLDPANFVFNVNHCHGIPCDDVEERTFEAISAAAAAMVPVSMGSGRGEESHITENRRMVLADGSESDVRGAYALAPGEQVRYTTCH
eukprot:SAG25_NODE_446_length_7952_cov_2.827116_2_plen_185_part_00